MTAISLNKVLLCGTLCFLATTTLGNTDTAYPLLDKTAQSTKGNQTLKPSDTHGAHRVNDKVKSTPQIAIVIDDLGYSLEPARKLAALPYPLTFAVIPNSPHAHTVAALAIDAEQELILHVPMQTKSTQKWENGLNTLQDRDSFDSKLSSMLTRYPNIRGINNHGGSLLTEHRERMNWVMALLSQNKLFFLDSRTTSESQAISAAVDFAVPHISRDVFLDNDQSEAAIAESFQKLKEIALKQGKAVAIGHPYNTTLAQLDKQLPKLIDEGFDLRLLSDLINTPPPNHGICPESLGSSRIQADNEQAIYRY